MPETKEDKKINDDMPQAEDDSLDNENTAEKFERYHNSSSESEDEGKTDGNAFSHFLKRIKHHDTRMVEDSDDSSEESESEDEQSESQSEDESIDDDAPVTITDASLTQDPFETHFSKSPLLQLDDKAKDQNGGVQLVALVQNVRKVNTPMLNSSVDVHISGPLLDQWDSLELAAKDLNGVQSKEKKVVRKLWEQFAKGPYDHAREVLTRNWREVNKPYLRAKSSNENVFSSLQSALYPAISRYADVLMTAETRQVRHNYVSYPNRSLS